MRLIENSKTRNLYKQLVESFNPEEFRGSIVNTGLSSTDNKAKEILSSVIGQLSDGIWENSPGMRKYWENLDIDEYEGNLVILAHSGYDSPFYDWRKGTMVDDDKIRKYMATKIKQIVKIEAEDGSSENIEWKRDCEAKLDYIGYDETITVRDCYRVYDKLLGRIDRITESESIPNMNDENFEETVLRDFRLYLLDKYDDELYSDVTNDDINEYFTGMFYDIWDNDDLDSANEAEKIIRNKYNCLDSRDFSDEPEYDDGDTNWAAEEEADAIERMERRYGSIDESIEEHDLSKDLFGDEAANRMSQKEKDLERDLQYVRDIMAGKTVIDDKYHEELSLDTAKAWLRRDFVYVNGLSVYSPEEINKRLADEYPDIFSVNESIIEPIEGKQDYELDDYADKLQQELKSIYNDDEVNALRFEILDLLNKKERANNRASGNGLKYNNRLKELIKKAESYLNESVSSTKYTLNKCIDEIKAIDNIKDFYNKVREIIGYNDDEWNNNFGWEDNEIKKLQRIADARYEELKNEKPTKLTEAKKSAKEKKEDKRVVMQQGNVTCIKENSSYLVFENESDNEVEHDSEESAMQDFLERCGINPNNELENNSNE